MRPTTCGAACTPASGVLTRPRLRPIDDLQSAYYLSLEVARSAGRAGAGGHACSASHEVSIRSMEQIGLGRRSPADLHHARRQRTRLPGDPARPPRARVGASRRVGDASDRRMSAADEPLEYPAPAGSRPVLDLRATCCSKGWRATAGSTSRATGRRSPCRRRPTPVDASLRRRRVRSDVAVRAGHASMPATSRRSSPMRTPCPTSSPTNR